jgi:hypothetical protein
VKPLYKKGDKTSMTNYRPISLLMAFSTALKKAVHRRISQLLHTNKILVTEQYGFRKGNINRRSHYQIVYANLLTKKMHVGRIFCDLAKVFDCVNHEILLAKLHSCGIQGVYEYWFRSCVTKRRQK